MTNEKLPPSHGPHCDRCGQEFVTPAGLLIGRNDEKVFNLCASCYRTVRWIVEGQANPMELADAKIT